MVTLSAAEFKFGTPAAGSWTTRQVPSKISPQEKSGIRERQSHPSRYHATAIAIAALAGAFAAGDVRPAVAATPETRVAVTLFGQPCVLKGPLDEKTLKAVHAISPEQIAPPFTSSRTADQTRQAMDRLQKSTGVPSGLDRYREQLAAELKAQLAFIEGLEASRQAGSGGPLINATKPYLKPARQKELATLAGKLSSRGAGGNPQALVVEQLFDLFADAAASGEAGGPSDKSGSFGSEEEFHRAIRRLNIQYVCNFDVEDGAGGTGPEEGAEAVDPGAPPKPVPGAPASPAAQ